MRDRTAKFIVKTANGAQVTEKITELYVEEKSVRGTEFYTAYQANIDAQYVLDVHPEEFETAAVINGEVVNYPTEVIYKGIRRMIIRHYRSSINSLEVVVGTK